MTALDKPQLNIDADDFDSLFPEKKRITCAPGWKISLHAGRWCVQHPLTNVASWYATKEEAIQASWEMPVTHLLVCLVCGNGVEMTAQYRLCGACLLDLDGAAQRCHQAIDQAVADFQREAIAWSTYQDALTPELATKWRRLCDDRTTAQRDLDQSERGSYRLTHTAADRQRIIAARRAAHATVMARIERTRHNPQNVLSAVLAREDQYTAAFQAANAITQRWAIALQEVESAQGASTL